MAKTWHKFFKLFLSASVQTRVFMLSANRVLLCDRRSGLQSHHDPWTDLTADVGGRQLCSCSSDNSCSSPCELSKVCARLASGKKWTFILTNSI